MALSRHGHMSTRRISNRLRQAILLILTFVVGPSALLLSVGILVLVFSNTSHDVVFGVLIVSLVATMGIGCSAVLVYLARWAVLARLQTEFLAKVSHDLRTPLTSIRMFVETLLLGRAHDPEKVRQCLEAVMTETERLTIMIDRLLHWGRMEAGRRIYEPEVEDVGDIVDAALRAFTPQLLEAPARVERQIPGDLPQVKVDLDAMSEALLNLLQNAHRYTGSDKHIVVSGELRKRMVAISVTDNGPGVAEVDRRHIFGRFYRGKEPMERNLPGSGLGLAIVDSIVRAHHGRVELDGEVGQGARFTILLPAVTEEGADA
jgi:two-component system, OmpR family, phosphate regulon sensor histidine kinase PhoR